MDNCLSQNVTGMHCQGFQCWNELQAFSSRKPESHAFFCFALGGLAPSLPQSSHCCHFCCQKITKKTDSEHKSHKSDKSHKPKVQLWRCSLFRCRFQKAIALKGRKASLGVPGDSVDSEAISCLESSLTVLFFCSLLFFFGNSTRLFQNCFATLKEQTWPLVPIAVAAAKPHHLLSLGARHTVSPMITTLHLGYQNSEY